MSVAARKYMPIRITVLLVLGVAAVLFARARHLSLQQPPTSRVTPPELVGSDWLNTPKPIRLADQRGKVTMVEFWTFACSNCQANLPAYERIMQRFQSRGLTIVAIHTPELPQEFKRANVAQFVAKHHIAYPVLLDPKYVNWNRWHEQYWPSIYLIDKQGKLRYHWIGELQSEGVDGEAKLDSEIDGLLKE